MQERKGDIVGGRRSSEPSIHSRSWGSLRLLLQSMFSTSEVSAGFNSVNHHLLTRHISSKTTRLSGWRNVAAAAAK